MGAITVQGELQFQDPVELLRVEDLMRRFSAAHRFAFRRLLEGVDPGEIRKAIARLFGPNARYADGAVRMPKAFFPSAGSGTRTPAR